MYMKIKLHVNYQFTYRTKTLNHLKVISIKHHINNKVASKLIMQKTYRLLFADTLIFHMFIYKNFPRKISFHFFFFIIYLLKNWNPPKTRRNDKVYYKKTI